MRSFWRLLLLCLMAVALPVQGFAAGGGVHCGAMHERMHAATVQEHHHADAAMEHHGHAALHQHGHDGADDQETAQGGLSAFKCSACAACCVAIGLPTAALRLPAVPAESAQPSFAAGPTLSFLTSGPERPPRSVLA